MMQRLQEKEGTLESVCGEMQEKKAHYERRIGELSGRHNDANNRIKLLEVHVHMYNVYTCICVSGKSPERNLRAVLWLNMKGYLWFYNV